MGPATGAAADHLHLDRLGHLPGPDARMDALPRSEDQHRHLPHGGSGPRAGARCLSPLWWQTLAQAMVASLVPEGEIEIVLDDTLLHKSGRRVDGAGWWRDAVRSTGSRSVVALGLNLLVVTLRIRPPWSGEPLGLRIYATLHRKKSTKLSELSVLALQTVAAWFSDRQIRCCANGAYASPLIPQGNERITVISRMRRDAALYELAPKPTGKRGRQPRSRRCRARRLLGLLQREHEAPGCRQRLHRALVHRGHLPRHQAASRHPASAVLGQHGS